MASVPAGDYKLIADGIITASVDVTFELIWRRAGVADVPLATFTHHFDPLGGGLFDATPYEATMPTPAIDWVAGDQLVFRYTGTNSLTTMAYIPNGDGPTHNGRYPNITLP